MNSKKSRFKFKLSNANLAGIVLGILGGFLYYRFVGCKSGGCLITSNPYISMIWGALIGYLGSDIISPKEKKS